MFFLEKERGFGAQLVHSSYLFSPTMIRRRKSANERKTVCIWLNTQGLCSLKNSTVGRILNSWLRMIFGRNQQYSYRILAQQVWKLTKALNNPSTRVWSGLCRSLTWNFPTFHQSTARFSHFPMWIGVRWKLYLNSSKSLSTDDTTVWVSYATSQFKRHLNAVQNFDVNAFGLTLIL